MSELKKIAIIGGGVGGMSAAIYALRAGADVTLFEQYGIGGVTATLNGIENYPGFTKIDGFDLIERMKEQVTLLGVSVRYEKVLSVFHSDSFVVETAKGESAFDAVIVASGTQRNTLGIEKDYVGRGVSYCATCDGNFYRKKTVAVAGNGSQAAEEALYLSNLAQKVFLIFPEDELSADFVLAERLNKQPNVEIVSATDVVSLGGEEVLTFVTVKRQEEKEIKKLEIDGLFVAVGAHAQNSFLKIDVERKNGYIVVDDKMQTSCRGLFACGDVVDDKLKQIVVAAGGGAKAGHFCALYVKRVEKA